MVVFSISNTTRVRMHALMMQSGGGGGVGVGVTMLVMRSESTSWSNHKNVHCNGLHAHYAHCTSFTIGATMELAKDS